MKEFILAILDCLLSYLGILPYKRVTAYWIDSIDSTTPRCLQSVCASRSDYENRSCENNQKARVRDYAIPGSYSDFKICIKILFIKGFANQTLKVPNGILCWKTQGFDFLRKSDEKLCSTILRIKKLSYKL